MLNNITDYSLSFDLILIDSLMQWCYDLRSSLAQLLSHTVLCNDCVCVCVWGGVKRLTRKQKCKVLVKAHSDIALSCEMLNHKA